MEKLELPTPLGPVWLWGRARGRPTLLIVTGAFADAGVMDHFARLLPQIDVLRTHLPGNHCPPLSETSIAAYAAALDEALRQAVPGPLAVLGISAGALVALGLRAPNLAGLLLIEPPLFTEDVGALAQGVDAAKDPRFMHAIFGVADGQVVEPRDYSPLLDGLAAPAEVLLGDRPATQRPQGRLPSLVGERARRALAACPRVTVTTAPGAGHHIAADAGQVFVGGLQRLLACLGVAIRADTPADEDEIGGR